MSMLLPNIFFSLALGKGSGSILEGVIVTIIGVTVVFLVLGILAVAIYIVGITVNKIALKAERKAIEQVKVVTERAAEEEEEVVAAISAALAAYMLLKAGEKAVTMKPVEKALASLWNVASRLEAHNPEYSINRMNVDDVLIEEGLRRSTI
ncbi:MAG: hypothetical protein DRN26_03145 [Thermoplasmata archaeon]|nr:MAG: hypothetical protein DRN26_03145 [Thermoplasmata archaeon]